MQDFTVKDSNYLVQRMKIMSSGGIKALVDEPLPLRTDRAQCKVRDINFNFQLFLSKKIHNLLITDERLSF